MRKRQRCSAECKREVVRLLKAGDRPAAIVVRELGIPRNRLYKWAKDLEKKGDSSRTGIRVDFESRVRVGFLLLFCEKRHSTPFLLQTAVCQGAAMGLKSFFAG